MPFGNGGASAPRDAQLTYGKCVPHPQVRAGKAAWDKSLRMGRRRPPIQLGLALAPPLYCCPSLATAPGASRRPALNGHRSSRPHCEGSSLSIRNIRVAPLSLPARLTCAPTPKSSCRSSGERQFDLSNCVVARDAIIRLELESDTRIGFADEERRLPRCGNAFYVTLGQNARAHLPICGPKNEPDKHHLSGREVLSALSDASAILLF